MRMNNHQLTVDPAPAVRSAASLQLLDGKTKSKLQQGPLSTILYLLIVKHRLCFR
jgi:hypothetical protein